MDSDMSGARPMLTYSLHSDQVHQPHYLGPNVRLTEREREVLTWVGRGKTSAEIAVILGVRERTVNFHCERAMRRLNVINRTQAVAKAIAHGLTSL
jgi:DNA-binding CsgD family transcriptional regulator